MTLPELGEVDRRKKEECGEVMMIGGVTSQRVGRCVAVEPGVFGILGNTGFQRGKKTLLSLTLV